MKKKGISAAVLALALAFAASARAEVFSLQQAVDYALTHNPDLAAAQDQVNAAEAERRAARGARLPQLDLSYSAQASDNPLNAFSYKLNRGAVTSADFAPGVLNDPGTEALYGAEISLRQPIYAGGRIDAEIRGADSGAVAAHQDYGHQRAVTVFRTMQAYLFAQAATEGMAIADQSVAAAQGHADTTARLLREGRIITSDNLSADVYLASVQGLRDQARAQAQVALARLKQIMGLPLDADLEIAPWPGTPSERDLPPVSELERQALAQRRDLMGLQAQIAAARDQVDVARAAHKPQINLMATNDWYDDRPGLGNHSWTVMGVVSLNLYAGGQIQNRVDAREAEVARLQEQRRALEAEIGVEVSDAYARYQEAVARFTTADANVSKAARAVVLVNERYGQGRTILLDLLQSERALMQARNERLAAALAVETSQAALDLATGGLDHSP